MAKTRSQKAEGIKKHGFWYNFKKNWQLHLLMLLPFLYLIIFEYAPLYGLQIAFKNFRIRDGIWGSAWVGLENFKKFFNNYKWSIYVGNTIKISLYTIAAGFPIPIILALMIHVNENKWLKKLVQNTSHIPHFFSVVVMVGILWQILNPFSGIFAAVSNLTGWKIFTTDPRVNPDAFIHMYVWSSVWQGMGWSSIVYLSALSAVPEELHEAARLDGASRWKRVLHVDLPTIMPTICTMLILRFGSIMSVGRDKVFLMQNNMNLDVSEVISTYVYKNGLAKNQLSYGTAVDLMNSAINISMVLLMNWIVRKISKDEQNLF